MNNISFIQKTAEALKVNKENPITIYTEGSKIVLGVNGQTWVSDTLDQSVNSMKQSFAILFLEQKETE